VGFALLSEVVVARRIDSQTSTRGTCVKHIAGYWWADVTTNTILCVLPRIVRALVIRDGT